MLWLTVLVDTALIVNTECGHRVTTIGTCQRMRYTLPGIDGLTVPAIETAVKDRVRGLVVLVVAGTRIS